MDFRVDVDPHDAVGGLWEEIGRLQFAFLVTSGLQPSHTLLDIGCGTLRGGRHFIRYLERAHYTGTDISPKAIECARRLVGEEGLSAKRPRLLVNEQKDLRFAELAGETFDYLLAHSIFTHLRPEHVEECFHHVGQVMHPNAVCFFTFNEGSEVTRVSSNVYRYPSAFFHALAHREGFRLTDRSADYRHPRGQRMMMLSRRPLQAAD